MIQFPMRCLIPRLQKVRQMLRLTPETDDQQILVYSLAMFFCHTNMGEEISIRLSGRKAGRKMVVNILQCSMTTRKTEENSYTIFVGDGEEIIRCCFKHLGYDSISSTDAIIFLLESASFISMCMTDAPNNYIEPCCLPPEERERIMI